MAEFKEVELKSIQPDPNQPRKFYDETAMQELVGSVKEKGILQPILIRPGKGKSYLLVCGERRYRAAKAAGLKSIPAVVRELSDNEALELQIIENLQRKDVHPLEEAVAFKSLSEKFTDQEIALRVGKSPSYVAKRIKLNDLIPLGQEIFFAGKMNYSDAIALARMEAEVQEELLTEEVPEDWKSDKEWVLENIDWMIGRKEMELKNTVFKQSDAKLYPEAGACTTCPHNSGNQPLLFDDQKTKICSKPSCFRIKTQRAYKNKFEKIASDPDIICVVLDSYLSEEEKQQLKIATEAGVSILDKKLYDRIYSVPEPTMDFESWKEDNLNMFDEEEMSEADWKKEYEEYKSENDKEFAEYQAEKQLGTIVTAFVVAGMGSGKEVTIRLKSPEAKAIVDATTGNAGDTEILEEIAKIEMREKRNKELDEEKIYNAVRVAITTDDKMPDDFVPTFENVWSLQQWAAGMTYPNFNNSEERKAIAAIIYDSISYRLKDEVNEVLFQETDPEQENIIEYFFGYDAKPDLIKIIQFFVIDKAFPMNGREESSLLHKASMMLARSIFQQGVAKAELEQQESAEQRQQRVAKRIHALKKKLSTRED